MTLTSSVRLPDPGVPQEIRPGIWCLPLVFPDGTGRTTLSYLIAAADGSLAVIDPGWDAHDELLAALALIGYRAADVTLVAATHLHVDHLAGAVPLQEAGARLALHPAEYAALTRPNIDTDRTTLDRWGVPRELQHEIVADSRLGRVAAPFTLDIPVAEGQLLPIAGRRLRAIWTPGHTPGHLCFWDADEDLLLTGDHVMPLLQPGLGLGGPTTTNPLVDYLAALARVRALGAEHDPEVAPGHGFCFRGLVRRCDAQEAHQLRRADAVAATLDRLRKPTLWQVAAALPWKRGFRAFHGHRLGSALGQTEFHVHRLGREAEVVPAGDFEPKSR